MNRIAADDVRLQARAAGHSPWFGWAGRVGLAAQGVSYLIVAVLALLLVAGKGGMTADRQVALRSLVHEPWGGPLLVALAAGFACYAAWRFANAFLDRDRAGDDPKGLAKRAADFGKGLFYGGLAVAVVRILFGADEGGEKQTDRTTAGVLDWPAGRWLVFGAAAGVGAAAVWNVYRGLSRQFEEDLEAEISRDARRWVGRLGLIGLTTRGLAFALIAWFLAKAAYEYDPQEAVGLGGALGKIASAVYGEALLAAFAAGLLAFGVFCLAQARYRDV